jgi:hypothetical protein
MRQQWLASSVNRANPTGKFHFKMYMMCCAMSNLTHKIKIHNRDNCDVDIKDEGELEEEASIIYDLTLEMCRSLFTTYLIFENLCLRVYFSFQQMSGSYPEVCNGAW